MFMANYFNTLMKDIMYNSYVQAIFNYPMEWMNLFCCWQKNPKDCIRELDFKYCCCDLYCSYVFVIIEILLLIPIYFICFLFLAICDCNRRND